ncbi:OLC1v1010663C1 [Oldenlandia corymbosa var. corymbosa]|uniref:RING-type E3 ubiquitin transferase n=1 Tax=Oldenlandia corymbosa var. corymbosa TaxID=529605 RepID=A0AAV1DRX5_OLDCO|nr:OLC1v1010663C1 [Oldenlandia corymbosa var. corymbosa]
MARFSLGGEDDEPGEAPGSSRQGSKRRKTSRPPTPPPPQPPPSNDGVELLYIESEPEYPIEAEEDEEGVEAESSQDDDDDDEEGEEEEEEGEERGDQEEEGSLENQQQPDFNEDAFDDDEPVRMTLTDPDVLDCPICLEPLSSPVFQCENGHIACSSCCVKIHNKCPTCAWPTGYNRCRAMEKVLEAVRIACRYTKYGCRQMLNCSAKVGHENTCSFGPCSCPLSDCGYTGPTFSFYSHFGRCHPHSAKNFFFNKLFSVSVEVNQKLVVLRESNETTIFVLAHHTEYNGGMMNVVRIASSSTPSPKLSYNLTAKYEDTSITLHSPVESISKWAEFPTPRKFILVPRQYVSSTGRFHLDVCIWKDSEVIKHIGEVMTFNLLIIQTLSSSRNQKLGDGAGIILITVKCVIPHLLLFQGTRISTDDMLATSDMEYEEFQMPSEGDLVTDKRKDLEHGEPEGSGKKKKRLVTTTRPACSWVHFSREFIKQYCASHPGLSGLKAATKAASDVWKLMSPDEKAKYASRSREVWDKYLGTSPARVPKTKHQPKLVTRCSPGRLLNLIQKLTPEQKASVKSMGFGSLLGLRCRTLRRSLCYWLLERFNTMRRTLEICGERIPLTPHDVELVMGLAASGKDVVNTGPDKLILELRQHYNATNQGISVRLLEERLAAPGAGEEFKRSFVLYVLGTLLCPTARLDVSPAFLHFLADVDVIHHYNWGKFLLDRLVQEVARYRQGKQRAVGGCLLFLQLFYYECVAVNGLHDLPPVSFPCLHLWGEEEISEREKQERELGGYGTGEVICKERGLGIGLQGCKNQVAVAPLKFLEPQLELCPAHEQNEDLESMPLNDRDGTEVCGDITVPDAVRGPCRNMEYGCPEIVDYVTRTNHEKTCTFAPCACPLRNCDFVGSSGQLALHFSSKHWDSGRRFQYDCPLQVSLGKDETCLVLQAEKDGVLFLLNRGTESIGHYLMITCVCPSSLKEQFSYNLGSERGSCSVRLKSIARNFPGRIEDFSPVDFLLVPFAYVSSSGHLDLEVCIWNSSAEVQV